MVSARPSRRIPDVQRIEAALAQPSQSFQVWYVREPDLVFGKGNRAPEPKTGLRIYGPCGNDDHAAPAIRIGIIGTGDTIDLARGWIDRCRRSVASNDPDVDPY